MIIKQHEGEHPDAHHDLHERVHEKHESRIVSRRRGSVQSQGVAPSESAQAERVRKSESAPASIGRSTSLVEKTLARIGGVKHDLDSQLETIQQQIAERRQRREEKVPPPWVAVAMMIIYPASLGLDETIADLCTRAYSSMLSTCDPVTECLKEWIFLTTVATGVTAGVASALFWMPIVYKRYETTVALPIEYGALNAGNLVGGLLVYAEDGYMEGWQIGLAIGGLCLILLGIAIGQLHDLHLDRFGHFGKFTFHTPTKEETLASFAGSSVTGGGQAAEPQAPVAILSDVPDGFKLRSSAGEPSGSTQAAGASASVQAAAPAGVISHPDEAPGQPPASTVAVRGDITADPLEA